MIPKIIWQTHNYKYEDLPENFKKCIASWKILNPEWEHRYVDHNEREIFMKENYPELYEVYIRKFGMYQADVWRVAVVYEFGGVYVDMDTFCSMPLDYMLQDKDYNCLITEPADNKSHENDHVNNAMFAAPVKCQSLKNVIDQTVDKFKLYLLEIKKSPEKRTIASMINNIDVHDIFSKEALKDYNPFFNAAYHGYNYKVLKGFFGNEKINYYGHLMTYEHYLREILKLSDDDIKNLI